MLFSMEKANLVVSLLALAVAGASMWFALEANNLSKNAFRETQRPKIVLNIAPLSTGRHLQFREQGSTIESMVSIRVSNIGNTPASNIHYTLATLKLKILGDGYEEIDMPTPPGVPLSLGPQQDYYYNAKAIISGFDDSQKKRIFSPLYIFEES